MAEVIRMPKMSDTMEEGVLVKWLKKVGDSIQENEVIAEVETDKAVMELESYEEGTLLHIHVKEKARVPIDGIIAIVGKSGEDFKALLDAPQSDKSSQVQQAPSKPSLSVSASNGGTKPSSAASHVDTPEVSNASMLRASPLAKRLAKEKGYNLQDIQGTGDFGRIIKRDIEAYTPAAQQHATQIEGYREEEMSSMRQTIANRLVASKQNAPHFYLNMEANMI